MRKCPKCGYVRGPKDDEFCGPDECPKCGTIYIKYQAYLAQKKEEEEAETEPAEEVHAAAQEVYEENRFGICYRSGRGIGYSLIEKPEFKEGDKTPLQAGMTFAVDGAITIPGEFGARVGDSIVVTESGFEYLTPYPKELRIL